MSRWRGPFSRSRGAPGTELPDGLWRADFARIDRACQRFVQVSGGKAEWGEVLRVLMDARTTAWQRCLAAAAVDPRPSAAVPGDPGLSAVHRALSQAAVHRALSQAAVQCAQAAQAVVMAGAGGDTAPATRAARRALLLVTSIETGPPGAGTQVS